MNNKTDIFAGIGIFLLSVLIYLFAAKLPQVDTGLGAGGFPQFVAVCMGGLGLLLSAVSFIKLRAEGDTHINLHKREVLLAAALVAGFAVYLMVVRFLGYLIATPIFFFLFGIIYGDRKWLRLALVSISFTIAVYLLFEKVFYIILPHGIL